MLMLYPDQPGRRLRTAAVDLAVLCWTLGWVAAGVAVARLVLSLQRLADGVTQAGRNLDQVIESFRSAVPADVPVIGSAFHQLTTSLEKSSGRQLIGWGGQAHAGIATLAVVLALLVALPPILNVSGNHVRRRYLKARELAAVAAFLAAARRSGSESAASAALAHRAVATLSFRDLMRTSANPAGDLGSERQEALAAALLESLGLSPRRLSAGPGPSGPSQPPVR